MVTSSQSSAQTNVPSDISQELSAFNALTTDEKLGLLWVLYDNMGSSVTPAAPGATGEQMTKGTARRSYCNGRISANGLYARFG